MSKSTVIVIRKPYDPVVVIPQNVGSVIEKDYRLKRDEHYNSVYIEVGERNIVDYIGSFANGCSLKAIIDRCSLMPVHDKVRYLQQREEGLSADLSNMPKDGFEAYKMLFDYKQKYPDVYDRIAKGESIDKIFGDIAKSVASMSSSSEPIQSQVAQNSIEGEVNNNGTD